MIWPCIIIIFIQVGAGLRTISGRALLVKYWWRREESIWSPSSRSARPVTFDIWPVWRCLIYYLSKVFLVWFITRLCSKAPWYLIRIHAGLSAPVLARPCWRVDKSFWASCNWVFCRNSLIPEWTKVLCGCASRACEFFIRL